MPSTAEIPTGTVADVRPQCSARRKDGRKKQDVSRGAPHVRRRAVSAPAGSADGQQDAQGLGCAGAHAYRCAPARLLLGAGGGGCCVSLCLLCRPRARRPGWLECLSLESTQKDESTVDVFAKHTRRGAGSCEAGATVLRPVQCSRFSRALLCLCDA
jgi:hypothetical protein